MIRLSMPLATQLVIIGVCLLIGFIAGRWRR